MSTEDHPMIVKLKRLGYPVKINLQKDVRGSNKDKLPLTTKVRRDRIKTCQR